MRPLIYARLTRLALWSLTVIVVTGTTVRLTGSGLGCSDWPTCEEDKLIAPLEYHALIEFGNRIITGLVAAAVIAAVLGSLKRKPRRKDLVVWSFGLVAGVLGQVLLGALLVRTELDPRFVTGHFLLSMVLLWNAVVLDIKARRPDNDNTPDNDSTEVDSRNAGLKIRLLCRSVFTTGAVVLVSGTLVTGSGPHAGDSRAERLPLLVREVVRVHSGLAVSLLVIVMVSWIYLRSLQLHSGCARKFGNVAVLLVLQGIVGYTQYFSGLPPLLVGIHVTLASLIWIGIVRATNIEVWMFAMNTTSLDTETSTDSASSDAT